LASTEHTDEYHEHVVKGTRTLLDVLTEMPSIKPPLDKLLELIPRLQVPKP
jgi:sulfite reductase alpha subunit-like flavoprotein